MPKGKQAMARSRPIPLLRPNRSRESPRLFASSLPLPELRLDLRRSTQRRRISFSASMKPRTASSQSDDSSSVPPKAAEGLAASPTEIKEAEEADPADFAEESPPDRFEKAWLLATGVRRDRSLPGVLRCRVLRHERAWVVLGLLGPREEDDPTAFAENLRALELATTTLRIKG